jgi:hypothetical protein
MDFLLPSDQGNTIPVDEQPSRFTARKISSSGNVEVLGDSAEFDLIHSIVSVDPPSVDHSFPLMEDESWKDFMNFDE